MTWLPRRSDALATREGTALAVLAVEGVGLPVAGEPAQVVGTIEALDGPDVSLAVGDRVAVVSRPPCGVCRACRVGLANGCSERPRLELVVHNGRVDAVVPDAAARLVPVVGGLVIDEALLAARDLAEACSLARAAEIAAGARIAVIGCGPVGLLALEVACLFGAAGPIAVDEDPFRRAVARDQFGVETVASAFELPAGELDACLVTRLPGSDGPAPIALATAAVRRGGTVAVEAGPRVPAASLPLDVRGARGVAVRFPAPDPRADGAAAGRLIAEGSLAPAWVVTHRFALDAPGAALPESGVLKAILVPGG